ncbi:MAG: tail fiber protein [Planctomycetota bacterium]
MGQIQPFGFDFAPRGWAKCDGQLLAIAENSALFSLLGTIYGGDGRTTFGLPDLRSRSPMHHGQGDGMSNRPIGQKGGTEQVLLDVNQIPSHSHTAQLKATDASATENKPHGALLAGTESGTTYHAPAANVDMAAEAIVVGHTGGNMAHDNMAPYQVINYCIAITGVYPSRS